MSTDSTTPATRVRSLPSSQPLLRTDFRFELPPELIAQYPLAERSASRLLVCGAGITHRTMRDLPELLQPGDHLVFNDTRVIRARLQGRKASGGRIEMLVERLLDGARLLAKLRSSKSPRSGTLLRFGDVEATVIGRHDDLFELQMRLPDTESVARFIDAEGALPLPPYIDRTPEAADLERYQTVYAREAGAVAAPTAGLHFDEALLGALHRRDVSHSYITLHVGAGTFQPLRVDDARDHVMHAERVSVPAATIAAINEARANGGRIVAVGTTSVRALEAASSDGRLAPFDGDTRLFLTPGCEFHTVDAMITNFHLPESTLLMLVCAFAGTDRMLDAYAVAVEQSYRFFSYGDAMLIWPQSPGRNTSGRSS